MALLGLRAILVDRKDPKVPSDLRVFPGPPARLDPKVPKGLRVFPETRADLVERQGLKDLSDPRGPLVRLVSRAILARKDLKDRKDQSVHRAPSASRVSRVIPAPKGL